MKEQHALDTNNSGDVCESLAAFICMIVGKKLTKSAEVYRSAWYLLQELSANRQESMCRPTVPPFNGIWGSQVLRVHFSTITQCRSVWRD